jgi:hypothetical protein
MLSRQPHDLLHGARSDDVGPTCWLATVSILNKIEERLALSEKPWVAEPVTDLLPVPGIWLRPVSRGRGRQQ